jgi:hypothetical protein
MSKLLIRFGNWAAYAQEAAIATVLLFLCVDHIVDLGLYHSAERGIEDSLRQVCDMLWYAFSK